MSSWNPGNGVLVKVNNISETFNNVIALELFIS